MSEVDRAGALLDGLCRRAGRAAAPVGSICAAGGDEALERPAHGAPLGAGCRGRGVFRNVRRLGNVGMLLSAGTIQVGKVARRWSRSPGAVALIFVSSWSRQTGRSPEIEVLAYPRGSVALSRRDLRRRHQPTPRAPRTCVCRWRSLDLCAACSGSLAQRAQSDLGDIPSSTFRS